MGGTSKWQLRMFRKTLKKQLRLRQLGNFLEPIEPDARCLLLTCGDNNGAINYYLEQMGGRWNWADADGGNVGEMSELLGQDVHVVTNGHLPFADNTFDIAISIDVHEHVEKPVEITKELQRVCAPGGRILITVPGGDPKKAVNRLKARIGMTKEKYGHVRDGFSTQEVEELMRAADISPARSATFSRFFTELAELAINYAYVNVLSKPDNGENHGPIAPQTAADVHSVKRSYQAYSMVYPLIWLFSRLDVLLFFVSGYVVMVEGRKS